MRAVVVNCSYRHYNLGARKLRDWLVGEGWEVEYYNGDPGFFVEGVDLVALSVIFSWDVGVAREIALRVKGEVWCGGPGMSALGKWWERETGRKAVVGLDWRFERQRGEYKMTFASRGCPVGCWFCMVPKLEGKEFTLDWEFEPAVMLCDNNLSALPVEFQEHILKRYAERGMKLYDTNSGFEPRTFTEETYRRWRGKHGWAWRFAFDEYDEWKYVQPMMEILKGEGNSSKRVYVLVGNETMEQCYERACKVVEWGGCPYVQPVMPLNALSRDELMIRHDWTFETLKGFQTYYNGWVWRTVPIDEFEIKGKRPFQHLRHDWWVMGFQGYAETKQVLEGKRCTPKVI